MTREEVLRLACEEAGLNWVGATFEVPNVEPRYLMNIEHPAPRLRG